MARQHTHMYKYGERGSVFSVESMRTQAKRRLENLGYTSTIHMHAHNEDCSDHQCEYYGPDEGTE